MVVLQTLRISTVKRLARLRRQGKIVAVFDRFRPTLVHFFVETLYHAHVDENQSFSLTQKDIDKLPNHLSCRLLPYINIIKEESIGRRLKKRKIYDRSR